MQILDCGFWIGKCRQVACHVKAVTASETRQSSIVYKKRKIATAGSAHLVMTGCFDEAEGVVK